MHDFDDKQQAELEALRKPVSFMYGDPEVEWLTDGTAAWRADGPQPTQTEILRNRDRIAFDVERVRGFLSNISNGVQAFLGSQDPDKPGSMISLFEHRSVQRNALIKVDGRFLPLLQEGFFLASQGPNGLCLHVFNAKNEYVALIAGLP